MTTDDGPTTSPFTYKKPVGNWRRWANIWRLKHSYDADGVAVEFYRTRKGVVITRVVEWHR